MKIEAIVFDLGNVLVDWNPNHLYQKIFSKKEEREHFLNNICNMTWHSEQDAGRSPEEATEMLVKEHPDFAHPIRAFYARWKEMFGGPIEGSVKILKELKERGHKLYALSNWNAELFNRTIDDYPFLQWFDGKVISGEVKLKKPDEPIFHLLLEKFHLQAQHTLFIDDSKQNIETAERLGFQCIHFTNPESLRQKLNDLQLLG
ncbi:MAG: HAD family phosphatase [Chitinophagaceae bacterium]|nr:MAG: HAD family phosphatase [Chitinophagaceae bacterium]